MSDTSTESFPSLSRPPIVEVVCGVHYAPLDLDGIVLGVYWDQRKDAYPEHSLQPAVADNAGLILGYPPLRAVLVSTDKVRVLQVQHDRLFVNWRSVGDADYPRFSKGAGKRSLLLHTLEEYDKFGSFCRNRLGTAPSPHRVELAKIDILERKRHWADPDDLERLLKIMGTFAEVHHGGTRELALRFVEHDANRTIVIAVNTISDAPDGALRAVRIETRALNPVTGDVERGLLEANAAVNRAFFRLISGEQLERFGVRGGEHNDG